MSARRVVISGIGVISCIGLDQDSVTTSLREGRSGIRFDASFAEVGMRSQVSGQIGIKLKDHIDKKILRFMGDGAAFAYLAMEQAIADAGLNKAEVSNSRTGIIAGSGGGSTRNQVAAVDTARSKGAKRVGPTLVPRAMASTVSATLSVPFEIKGYNYSITSACATSLHCIGNAYETILAGRQDMVFAGGGEELDWTSSLLFDAMGALSSKHNDSPSAASRPYDADRDGFVIAGGGGMVVVEEYEHCKARSGKIYGEITGYGVTSDGYDMVVPHGEGAAHCMAMALADIGERRLGYINTHGTSTPVGDIPELHAIAQVCTDLFGGEMPPISSTKALTGHSLGATGVQEVIYCLLMIKHGFIAPSYHVANRDPMTAEFPILEIRRDGVDLDTVITNSFGFGGVNATLALSTIY
ncbi:MAG: beta-ketoacyl-ACP synthase I [Alphaproteobacteria bacterium]|nr:beta-ketoacyl-ACP synthase I [Alphaproteobacteria bacterium]